MLQSFPGGGNGQVMRAAPMQQPMGSAPSPFMAQLGLPPAIMALFAPRPPIPYKKPIEKRAMLPYSGVGACIALFETELPSDLDCYRPPESKRQRKERLQKEKKASNEAELVEKVKSWNPAEDPKITSDPYKTLFVARLSYKATEEQLEKEFSAYGPITQVKLVKDKEGNPKGYGFIEFESKTDMNAAYKFADGKQIGNRCVLVDIEKGRAVKNWRPRRLGGGLGRTRAGGKGMNEPSAKNIAPSTADSGKGRREYSRYSERDRDTRDNRDSWRGRDTGGRDRRERGAYERSDRDRRDRGSDRYGDRDRERDRPRDRDRDRGDRDRDRDRDRERRDRGDRDRRDRGDRERRGGDRDRDRDRDRKDKNRDKDRDRRGDRDRDRAVKEEKREN
eukprot:TRINITY_DN7114_c4_g1_i1.p1 TRINITY_DN7114_c4_g1~~TRINITY_DN7114_c4_g1_i1.p1  ORF type:complete len:413 (+),score=123.39 TRINITY_DN7114_c4_g1_i1:68-1240(+)